MKRALVLLSIVSACSTEHQVSPDASPDASAAAAVTITTASCTASPSTIMVDAALDVVLEPGQALDTQVSPGLGAGAQWGESFSYSCGTWTVSRLGGSTGLQEGCQRDGGQTSHQPVTMKANETIQSGTVPATVNVRVTAEILSKPLLSGGTRVLTAVMNVQCPRQ